MNIKICLVSAYQSMRIIIPQWLLKLQRGNENINIKLCIAEWYETESLLVTANPRMQCRYDYIFPSNEAVIVLKGGSSESNFLFCILSVFILTYVPHIPSQTSVWVSE